MWPIELADFVRAIGPGVRPAGKAPRTGTVSRAIGWLGPSLGEGDAFFALGKHHHATAAAALRGGALVVVRDDFPALKELDAAARGRCFLTPDSLAAYRRLAAFLRARFPFPVVAVGGSNGKTTTKEMITAVLRAGGRVVTSTPGTNNGWEGLPITLCHHRHTAPAPSALVLEIGIDAPDAMRDHVAIARPDVAVLTALGPEHLAGLGTHEGAAREELELFAGSKRRVWLATDPMLARHLGEARPSDLVVHREEEPGADDGVPRLAYAWRALSPAEGTLAIAWEGARREVRVPLPGPHNGRNAALAIGVALLLGRSLDDAVAGFGAFRPPRRRCRVARLASGSILVDDCYNASPASVEAALDVVASFDPSLARVIVLGDMLDLGAESARWHDAIAARLETLEGAHLRFYGDETSRIAPRMTRAASVGRAKPPDDPAKLADVGLAAPSVILVKGSRGMKLERVVRHLEGEGAPVDRAAAVVLSGEGAAAIAAAIGPGARIVDRAEIEDGGAFQWPFAIAVLAGLDVETEIDVERALALTAQLLVRLPPGGVAVLASDGSAADEALLALLETVVPAHATIRRTTPGEAAGLVASLLAT